MSNRLPDKQIERPLGLDGRKSSRRERRTSPGVGQIGAALVVLCIVATSSYIALDERPFRSPPTVVISTPEMVARDQQAPAGYPPVSSGGPSIIKVESSAEPAGNVIVVRDPTVTVGQDPRVAHLPERDLVEQTDFGPLPIRAVDGRRPFDVYARPWSGARGARVAIVIGGIGVSQTGSQYAIANLPPEVTLAFASGGNSLDRWMAQARQNGHEIVLQVPLEPFDYPEVDPGRNTLTVDANPEENRDRLYRSMSRITNYTGLMNYMGARFVTDETALSPFFGELARRGLMYLDDGTSARSLAQEMAAKAGVPYAAADIAIDGERERGAILKKLDEAERTARAKGFAIATGSAFDVTVDAVASWAQEARRRGIEIVPVSALAHDPEKG